MVRALPLTAGWLLLSAPAASLATPLSTGWTDEPREGRGAEAAPPPRMLERRDMIDELQLVLGEWRTEAQEWVAAQRVPSEDPPDEADAPPPTPKADGKWMEDELGRLEAQQQASPETSPESDAWEQAAEKKRAERAAAIEAEAERIQHELDAARRREAEERAKQLGGSLDRDGNFVDPDLEDER